MQPVSAVLTLALAGLALGQGGFLETLTAAGLIGSHFGVPSINKTYSYVVVGGGTAGLTVATRLAQNASNTVAVIEAGSFYEITNGNNSQVPGLAAQFLGADPALRNPQVDWDQVTEPNPGLGGRRIFYTSGKTLGGSSARNYMLYMRSAAGVYQRWADQVDDQSYAWEQFLPYFKKSVDYQGVNDQFRLANATPQINTDYFDPQGGPLKVSYPNFATSFATWVAKALQQIGFTDAQGFITGNILGYSYAPFALDKDQQIRSSSESSFLRYALQNTTNLNVYTSTLAKKIVFNGTTAQGVLVNAGGNDFLISASKEVIVSSGTFRSPQLLMASGIGPKKSLEDLNITVVADRPGVGQGLMDHVSFGVDWAVDLVTHSAFISDPLYALSQYEAYLANRTGAFTSTGGELIAFQKLGEDILRQTSERTREGFAKLPCDWPEIELFFSDAYAGDNKDFTASEQPNPKLNYGTAEVALVAPFSRGNVTISSQDTSVLPTVNLNLLGDHRDKLVAMATFKRLREWVNTSVLKDISIGPEAYPGANVTTDRAIWAAIQKQALPVYHAAGTCGMGKREDRKAVVDSHARVIGVDGLRVVDASAFPFLPPGHPQGTVYALAEKIADEINQGN